MRRGVETVKLIRSPFSLSRELFDPHIGIVDGSPHEIFEAFGFGVEGQQLNALVEHGVLASRGVKVTLRHLF